MKRVFAACAVCFALCVSSPAHARITAWLDYTNFDTRLGELAASAGVTPYSAPEQLQLRANIFADLNTIYGDYDVTFTETRPVSGDYERLVWGQTGSDGTLGLADRIDFRNLNRNDVSRIYTANFAFFVDEFDGLDNRTAQIAQLSRGFAGTAAHELGHNIGLEHCDCYGCREITPANYANTQGLQNRFIIATGSTGLEEDGREALRSFGEWERVKLAYADGVSRETPPVLSEQALPHDSLATAQALTLTNLSTTDAASALVVGGLGLSGEQDFFSFTALAGETITARVLSDVLDDRLTPFDTLMSLFSPTDALLFEDDDTQFRNNTFNVIGTYSTDTFFVNIPVTQTGTYTLAVSAFTGSARGQYELLVARHGAQAVVVPESGAAFLLTLGILGGWLHLSPRRNHGIMKP
ncbi:MAG: hypothetical protein H7Y38_10960 [Armatimonadetes bacterium]|nr:hypothetical protein [Armatimonadota bacterium]